MPYEFFLSRADGELPRAASEIAEVFFPLWWEDEEFEDSRSAWRHEAIRIASPLKIEVARRFARAHEVLPISGDDVLAKELNLLKEAEVDGIITTNYDLILEELFPSFEVFVGQDEMLFANPQGIGEIYKVRGCCSKPNSLVLTGEDYELFDRRNPYLAAKLLAVFVEHPVIFLGYSLDDPNVQRILSSIAGCLNEENVDELTERLIFVRWAPGILPGISSHTMSLGDAVLTVKQVVVSDFVEVFSVLSQLERTFPAAVLRRLKDHVYQLVLTDDPEGRLVVVDIDSEHGEEIDVVFGVGLKQQLGQTGYIGLGRSHLLEDVLSEGSSYEPAAIVSDVLPRWAKRNAYIPVFKYLRGAGLLTKRGDFRADAAVDDRVRDMAKKIRDGMSASAYHHEKAKAALKGIAGVQDLCDKLGAKSVFSYGLELPSTLVDPTELRNFLQAHKGQVDSFSRTQWGKLVCMLDWIEHGNVSKRSSAT